LRAHAKRVGADPSLWSWLTGNRDDVDGFARPFGVQIMRGDTPQQEIVHNLRTAVVDRDGKVVTILNGSEWKADELLAALRAADAR
jgi:cytochrome oxidase Cu insertion factor (SCO1/SenC/PrrC family)